jgi:hypothetical protein
MCCSLPLSSRSIPLLFNIVIIFLWFSFTSKHHHGIFKWSCIARHCHVILCYCYSSSCGLLQSISLHPTSPQPLFTFMYLGRMLQMCWDMPFLLALCFSFFVTKTFVHKTNVKVDTSIYHIG